MAVNAAGRRLHAKSYDEIPFILTGPVHAQEARAVRVGRMRRSASSKRGADLGDGCERPGLGSSADGKGEEGIDRSFERTGIPKYLGE